MNENLTVKNHDGDELTVEINEVDPAPDMKARKARDDEEQSEKVAPKEKK